MKTPLQPVQIMSVYRLKSGQRVPLPARLASCTPDTAAALAGIEADLERAGGDLYLSDLFRSYEMQLQAHIDYTSGKKTAFSPAPGGSMHEAGRAFDLDLRSTGVRLEQLWGIAARYGAMAIIKAPDPAADEAWHFDRRGSHDLVYAYYAAGKGSNLAPYQAMAASEILSTGLRHDAFAGREREALLQSLLIRLGHDLGNLDGFIGRKTRAAMAEAGLADASLDAAVAAAEDLVQEAHPEEYRVSGPVAAAAGPPAHVIG